MTTTEIKKSRRRCIEPVEMDDTLLIGDTMKKTIRIAATLTALAILAVGCGDNSVNSGGRSEYLNTFLSVFSKKPNNDGGKDAAYTLTVNVSPSDGGMVSRNIEKEDYKSGTKVTVTATPYPGYTFLNWSGALNSANAELTITMNGDKTLTAGFIKEGTDLPIYDVYFNANGATGGAPAATRTVSGNSITLPDQASMEKPGYSFVGWHEDKNGTGIRYNANTSYTVTRGITLYAKWIPIYTITFNANNATDGNVPAAVTADSGTVIKLPNKGNIAKDGYNFGGWSTSSTGTGDDYGEGVSYHVMGNITIYARWIEVNNLPEYDVAYDGNGNTDGSIANTAVTYKQGSVINLRSKGNLVKEGYSFDGWSVNPSGTGTVYQAGSSYTVTDNTTFYAKWTALPTYTVTFDDNGATSGNPPANAETYSGNSITLSGQGSMAKDGYSFGGWNTNSIGTGTNYNAGTSYTVKQNITLYAKWTAITTFTVTFNGNGNTNGSIPPQMSQDSGKTITLPGQNDMERSGYNFGGWNTNNSGTGSNYPANSSYTVTKNITLYAKWTTVNAYTVTFNGNNNTSGVAPSPISQEAGKTITLPDQESMERTGYSFGGWNTNSGGTGTNYNANSSYSVSGNIILYAKWTKVPEYTVTFSGNNQSSGNPPASEKVYAGNSIIFPSEGSLEKNGYTFGGWNTNNSGTGINYNANDSYTVTGNITFYVKWVELPKKYTVTFDGNYNTSGTVPSPISQDSGKAITLPDQGSLVKDGYSFSGWSTSTGANYYANSSYTVTENITLYARWFERPQNCSVYYDGNGNTSGNVSNHDVLFSMGAVIKIGYPGNLAKEGFTFEGWCTDRLCNGTVYQPGSSYTLTECGTTFYAKWIRNTYTLTVNASPSDGGTVSRSPNQTEYNHGASVTVTATAANGYEFTGWSGAATGTTNPVTITMNENKTLTANFQQIIYYTLTTSVSPSGGGTVSRSPNQISYVSGESVTIMATAASGYTFTGWSGTALGTTNPMTINMDGSKTMTANFQVITNCTSANTCKQVTIGSQTWMAENLNIVTADSWCFGNNSDNCAKYGRLYTWEAAKKACPASWHLPTSDEWETLSNFAGGGAGGYGGYGGSAGSKLKSKIDWRLYNGIVNEDTYGFSALPGGYYRMSDDNFYGVNEFAHWWTASEFGSSAYTRRMDYYNDDLSLDSHDKSDGLSVRCVKDE